MRRFAVSLISERRKVSTVVRVETRSRGSILKLRRHRMNSELDFLDFMLSTERRTFLLCVCVVVFFMRNFTTSILTKVWCT